MRGVMGLMGLMGRIGRMGRMGRMGLIGLIGPMGLIGRIGLMGLMGLIGPIGLMGCSSGSDDVEWAAAQQQTTTTGGGDEGTAISFYGGLTENEGVTRAAEGTTRATAGVTRAALKDKATTFRVWAYKNTKAGGDNYTQYQTVMPGYVVNWDGLSEASTKTNTSGWEYVNQQTTGPEQTIKYWDWDANAYRFFGVTGLEGTQWSFVLNETNGVLTMTVDATNEDTAPFYTKLWFSTGHLHDYNDKQFGQPVKLEFQQPIARVRFIFVSADPAVDLADLNLEDPIFKPATKKIAVKGTVTVTYPITGTEKTESWESTRGTQTGAEIDNFNTPEKWYAVLPIREQENYRLTVTVNGDVNRGCRVPAQFMTWLPNRQYTYIFKVDEEGGVDFGEVTSVYTDWEYGAEGDLILYNW